jgi:hypothetical protein
MVRLDQQVQPDGVFLPLLCLNEVPPVGRYRIATGPTPSNRHSARIRPCFRTISAADWNS